MSTESWMEPATPGQVASLPEPVLPGQSWVPHTGDVDKSVLVAGVEARTDTHGTLRLYIQIKRGPLTRYIESSRFFRHYTLHEEAPDAQ